MLNQFTMILPEVLLASIAMLMQIIGVYCKGCTRWVASTTSVLALGLVCYLLFNVPSFEVGFSGSFVISSSIFLFKALVLGLTLMSLVIYHDLTKIAKTP